MNDNEQKPLTYEELRALGHGAGSAGWSDFQRKRPKEQQREEVSEETLISLGGKKVGATIVFGSEGETQLTFKPSKGA